MIGGFQIPQFNFDIGGNFNASLDLNIDFDNILNSSRCRLLFPKSPPKATILSNTGSGANIIPISFNNQIIGAYIENGGKNYIEFRDVVSIDNGGGNGSGAELIIRTDNNGTIRAVDVIRSGNGYVDNSFDFIGNINFPNIIIPIVRNIDVINVGNNYNNPKTKELENLPILNVNGKILAVAVNRPFVGFFGRRLNLIDDTGYGAKLRINYLFLPLSEIERMADEKGLDLIYSKSCPAFSKDDE